MTRGWGEVEYGDVAELRGPLVVLRGTRDVGWDEFASIRLDSGEQRHGRPGPRTRPRAGRCTGAGGHRADVADRYPGLLPWRTAAYPGGRGLAVTNVQRIGPAPTEAR